MEWVSPDSLHFCLYKKPTNQRAGLLVAANQRTTQHMKKAELLPCSQAAHALGIGADHLRLLARQKKVASYRNGSGKWAKYLFSLEDLQAYRGGAELVRIEADNGR